MIRPWPKIRSSVVGDFRVFKIRSDIKCSPRTGAEHDFFVIDCVDWANVIAITADNRVVMIEQYRHGSNTVELEIPGGMIEPDDQSPIEAGIRELREETGYEGENMMILGQVFPNPAIMTNTCYTVLMRNCQQKHPTSFDHTEDLITRLIPVDAIQDLVASGRIQHSMVVVALYHFELWRKNSLTTHSDSGPNELRG